ncbi:MAG: hypothetical protein ACOC9P_02645 [bacterium]
MPRFLDMYRRDELPVDMLKPHTPARAVNEAFDTLDRAEAVRQVVVFDRT